MQYYLVLWIEIQESRLQLTVRKRYKSRSQVSPNRENQPSIRVDDFQLKVSGMVKE
jgi:hypothetical protein